MWEALGAPSDPGEAAILGLAFRPSDQSFSGADEASLSIHIEDRLAVTASRLEHDTYRCVQIIDGEEVSIDADCRRLAEESECSGLGRIEVGQLDAEACIKEYVENLEEYLEHAPAGVALGESADVSFTRRTIRGRPSLLVEADNFGVSILTVEGGGVISIVEGLGLSRDAVIEVAEGLRPASLTEFQSYMG